MAKPIDIPSTDPAEIEALILRLKQYNLEQRDAQLLERLLRLVLSMASLLQQKNASIKRLKRMIFGPSSDARSGSRTKPQENNQEQEASLSTQPGSNSSSQTQPSSHCLKKPSRKGHGRNSASAYTGAPVLPCQHAQLKPGSGCPDQGCTGHLYDTNDPAIFIRLTGQPLVGATQYHQQVLRCSACQQRFTAPLPEGVAPEKYDATADVAIAMAKYAAAMPYYRLARLQAGFGVPLPSSVQFQRCEAVANALLPVFLHLRELAASGEVFYSDDTRVKILSCSKENALKQEGDRCGVQTTSIVVKVGQRWIALYASGRQHAGENLDELLKKRDGGLGPPIQMGDALASNWSGKQEAIVSKCLAHARRKFIEIEESFPQECGRVLDAIGEVYGREAETAAMNADERLIYHKQHSRPVLEELHEWIDKQFTEAKVEPNSLLGQALRYVLKHWEGLTRFLTVAGAPLDNNLAEQALKRAVLLRKNALFYKNEHGAAVADILLSMMETCRMNGLSAWEYLVALMRSESAARGNPEDYLPWSYPRAEPGGGKEKARAA
jgi:transposase